jgi:hypothetical protein
MASLIDHLHQSKHNQNCAKKLLQDDQYRDWAITVTFYSALHYTEAGLLSSDEKYIPKVGEEEDSAHQKRLKAVRKIFGDICYLAYKKLFEASFKVRYIEDFNRIGSIPSLQYFTFDDAQDFLTKKLETVKSEIQRQSKIDLTN